MADRFIYNGTSYALSRRFDLGGSLARSRGNELIRLDSGRRSSYTRRIPERVIRLRLEAASRADRALVERFFYDVVQGSRFRFDLVLTGAWREVVQCGAQISAATLLCGQSVDGATLKCGQWITADEYRYNNCRFAEDNLSTVDMLDENADLELEIVQELDA